MKKPESFDVMSTDVMAAPSSSSVRPFAVVLSIDDPEAGGAAEIVLKDGTCRIGSASDNDLVIRHRNVSRAHAELTLTNEGSVLVRDLGSRNGTFYLGQRIGSLSVAVGARIQLGSVTLAIDPDTESLVRDLDAAGAGETSYRGLLGASERMRRVFALLRRLESSLATVLIEGESGVGKEVVAAAIHAGSRVASRRMVTLNCGAIPKELIASELFGHRRGAFSGAVESRQGAFDAANGGTLFLDEIGELPLEVQPALLRALDLGEIRGVGHDETHSVNVRVIAATNRDLESEVQAGRFRQDLYYRLAVVRVTVAPLRSRPEDIPLLARHFAVQRGLPSLPVDLEKELLSRSWPGNVRELRNAIDAFLAVGELPRPSTPKLPSFEQLLAEAIDPTVPYAEQKEALVDQFTRAYLRSVLALTRGNQAAAARIGKLDRTYVSRLLNKYGLSVKKVE